ncbi:glycosyltransferase [Nonomuraea sp. NBC_00507]|uniref:glycosyltransferase n=1 Tax=Nonomuraea sp. NBC_00507 TaxID=2976002 RepID=UPI002E17FF42
MDTRAATKPAPRVLDTAARLASVDIVIPVLNEERALPGCVRTLAAFLDDRFPLPWRITIMDNGSTDATWPLAAALAGEFDQVHARRIDVRGRGAALRAAWRDSPADIVAYMDVDLSTDLDALFPLVAAVASGHSEIAIGTRLAHSARTRRSLRREVVSRSYNALLRYGFGAGFSDAQCGFKAARTDVVRPLMDKVEDNGWFFDTELLLLAEHNGLRVHEVPVDWIEDMDSRVRVARTAADDLKGLARLAWSMSTGRAGVRLSRAEPVPRHPDAVVARPRAVTLARFTSFAAIGVLSVILFTLIYLPLRAFWSPATANLAALVLTGIVNTEANRRWTFGRVRRSTMHVRATVLSATTYALTTAAVLAVPPEAGRATEGGAVVATYCLLTVIRFTALDRWVFSRTRG